MLICILTKNVITSCSFSMLLFLHLRVLPSFPTRRSSDLAALADGRTQELAPRFAEYAAPALAHLERALFEERPPAPVPLEGAVRFLEGAGARGTLELAGEELLALLRDGTPAEQIALVAPQLERWRAPLETVLGTRA